MEPIGVGLLGFGYWGPNLARNVANSDRMRLVAIAEPLAGNRVAAQRAFPLAKASADAEDVIADPAVSLVVVATPPATHFDLVSRALGERKHVLVEKPLSTNAGEARELVERAAKSNLHLLVDHTFLFTGAVQKIREELASAGGLLYYDATRTNLGTFQSETDVLWDLAPHDLSILLSLIPEPVELVAAIGACHGPATGPTMAYLTLRFRSGPLAHIHVNWMAPAKVRRTIIGGTHRMLVYDDVESSEKLKIYESSGNLELGPSEDIHRRMVDYRIGDVLSPQLDHTEALTTEMGHVARVLLDGEEPVSAGDLGLRVVELIEAAHRSLINNGTPVSVMI
ncbi:MAG: Gfo/Idh/MocA family oxidoreductase [Dehalococcoidia bacterium]